MNVEEREEVRQFRVVGSAAGRGDKQESRRQFSLNYAEANFILMAETPPAQHLQTRTHA